MAVILHNSFVLVLNKHYDALLNVFRFKTSLTLNKSNHKDRNKPAGAIIMMAL